MERKTHYSTTLSHSSMRNIFNSKSKHLIQIPFHPTIDNSIPYKSMQVEIKPQTELKQMFFYVISFQNSAHDRKQ